MLQRFVYQIFDCLKAVTVLAAGVRLRAYYEVLDGHAERGGYAVGLDSIGKRASDYFSG